VVLDPGKVFPLVMPPPKMTEALLAERLDEMPWTGAGDKADRLYKHAVEIESKTRAVWRKLGLTLFEAGRYSEALDAFGRLSQVETDPKSGWHFGALAWMGLVNDVLHQRDAALSFYRRALATNSNATLNHEQFSLVIDRAWVEDRLQKPFIWPVRK
jgi:tetratricopeptide (TPR) repeat protein